MTDIRNPVARNNKHRGGPFKDKNKDGRSFRNQKIKKEIDQLDKKYIETELEEYKSNRNDS